MLLGGVVLVNDVRLMQTDAIAQRQLGERSVDAGKQLSPPLILHNLPAAERPR
jgi:hypothetical protein